MEPMRTKTRKTAYIKQSLKVLAILVAIPLTAWIAEFVYTNYLQSPDDSNPGRYIIMSNHGHEGYDYTRLNALLRKVRRIEMLEGNKPEGLSFEDYRAQLDILRAHLETEHRSFISYYYGMLDIYTQVNMPIKLRRRLHYYRTIIKHAIGYVKQVQEELYNPDNTRQKHKLI